MNRKILLISLIVIASVGYMIPKIAAAFDPAVSAISAPCSRAIAADLSHCQEMERQILRSTVRFLIQSWATTSDEGGYEIVDSVGHASVMGGRYLVTHNHFGIPLSIRPRPGDPEVYSSVSLFNAQGEQLLIAPLSDFEIVVEDAETLVFAYKEDGLFDELGLASARFEDWTSVPLHPGMEMAQIDWDGSKTRVDWTVVKTVSLEEGVPRVVLADSTMVGASGGGIFWNGSHVANNWRLEERLDAAGHVVGGVTTVALNSAQVLNPDGADQSDPS